MAHTGVSSGKSNKRVASECRIVPLMQSKRGGKRQCVQATSNEHIQFVRNEAEKNLSMSSSENNDLDFLVRSVRALININKEIWERCQQDGICRATRYGEPIVVGKYCYNEAVASRKKHKNALDITTQMSLESKNFGNLPSLPPALTNIIAPTDDAGAFITNYEEYFNKAVLLQDGILVAFLNRMQKHLEDVQLFWGSIEEWLLRSQCNVDFLSELFNTTLKAGSAAIEEENERSGHLSCTPTGATLCAKCLNVPSKHALSFGAIKRSTRKLPATGILPAKTRRNRRYTCHDGREASFFSLPSPVTILNSKSVLACDAMDLKFDLRTEDGRKKLQLFVSFIKMY